MNQRGLRCLAFAVAIPLLALGSPVGRANASSVVEPSPAQPAPKGGKDLGWDPGTVVVRFRPGVSEKAAEAVTARLGTTITEPVPGTDHVVVSTDRKNPTDVVAKLRRDPRVATAELNHRLRAAATPNDNLFASGRQSYLDTLGMRSAWDLRSGSPVTVAIVDTGVDLDHPDLPVVGPGRDFVNDDNSADDDGGHGTAVAGVAAARTNNSEGVAGSAWDKATILPVKVLDNMGSGTDADVAAGITWAADQGAKVINVSLGGPNDSTVLRSAVSSAMAKGAVVVAASGNGSSRETFYPAAYPGVVAVTATDAAGQFAYFSSYGPWVSVAAPGINLTSTNRAPGPVGSYATNNLIGTSFAAPVVSGIAAMVRAKYPLSSPEQVVQTLRSTARDGGPRGFDDQYGHGLVDPVAALGGTAQAPLPPGPPDALEPNDSAGTATALSPSANAGATISPEGDADWFVMEVNRASALTFTVQPPGAGPRDQAAQMDPVLDAYGPDLRPRGQADQGFIGQSEQLRVVARPGRYHLRVTNFVGSRSPGPYSVSVSVVPAAHDFDSDGRADTAVWRPGDGTWYVRQSSGQTPDLVRQWGLNGDIPLTNTDFDGDGRADMAVWRPSNGTWYVRRSSDTWGNNVLIRQWGLNGDIPLANTDFDNDGKADMAVWRPSNGTWYVRLSGDDWGNNFLIRQWGLNGDIPLANTDFDGDSRADMALWRPGNGTWYVRLSGDDWGNNVLIRQWGLNGDIPFANTDFDNDGKADMALWRPRDGNWLVRRSSDNWGNNVLIRQWGLNGDIPLANTDFDNDGKADMAVWRPSNGTWYVRLSSADWGNNVLIRQWGLNGDIPLANTDFDDDGMADMALWRPGDGTWYVLQSTTARSWNTPLIRQWGLNGDIPVSGGP